MTHTSPDELGPEDVASSDDLAWLREFAPLEADEYDDDTVGEGALLEIPLDDPARDDDALEGPAQRESDDIELPADASIHDDGLDGPERDMLDDSAWIEVPRDLDEADDALADIQWNDTLDRLVEMPLASTGQTLAAPDQGRGPTRAWCVVAGRVYVRMDDWYAVHTAASMQLRRVALWSQLHLARATSLNREVLAITDVGAWLGSSDAGRTFHAIASPGLEHGWVVQLASTSDKRSAMHWVLTNTGRLFVTSDLGTTWTRVTSLAAVSVMTSDAVSGCVYLAGRDASGQPAIARYCASDATWTTTPVPFADRVCALACSNDVLAVQLVESTGWLSMDGGRTFASCDALWDACAMQFLHAHDGAMRLLVATSSPGTNVCVIASLMLDARLPRSAVALATYASQGASTEPDFAMGMQMIAMDPQGDQVVLVFETGVALLGRS